jgi:hypothetical protein
MEVTNFLTSLKAFWHRGFNNLKISKTGSVMLGDSSLTWHLAGHKARSSKSIKLTN